jgi:outer membrane biogenesis lipoprotein LolB
MLVSTDSERQTLKFTWRHLSEDQDRVELRDALGLQSVILVKELNEYYQENEKGQRMLLSASTLEEPLARLLSGLPPDIARLLIGRSSSNSRVISEVVTWSNSTQFATPKVLRVRFGQYSLKIMVDQWDIGGSE